jgi:hypothetical protein
MDNPTHLAPRDLWVIGTPYRHGFSAAARAPHVAKGFVTKWIAVGFIADLSRHDLPALADSVIVRGRPPLP